MANNKNSNINKIILGLGLIILIFLIFFIKNKNPSQKIEPVSASLEEFISDDEKAILDKLEATSYPAGAYEYQSLIGEDTSRFFIFVSKDERKISDREEDIFNLSDGKFDYLASRERKTYYKEEIGKNIANETINHFSLSSFIDPSGSLYPDLIISKNDNGYIVKNSIFSTFFDSDGILLERQSRSSGEPYIERLVNYDPDFDKYYKEYMGLIESFSQVDSINLVSPK
ncbi:MAG: hypothetical protein Q4D88_00730 [Anaerococcus sp.]|nr:hypothetical protein [Anaerococcus sp.]